MTDFQVTLKREVDDSYKIRIGNGLTDVLVSDLLSGIAGCYKKFALITDANVKPLYADRIAEKLRREGVFCETFVLPAGEQYKTREEKARIEDEMLERGYRRDCCVIAVGGGVVTDLAGFLAGTFARGVPFVNYATTLLAAADASIGGKTAVDTPLATNLIGMFYQPKCVYLDLDTWHTLPPRQIQSGLAETIKHACLADAAFFSYLEEHMEDLLSLDASCCAAIAEKNCSIKYRVVMQDERESGLREVLNLGHTVGRAAETVSNYRLLHGEAVAIGLMASACLSHELGYLGSRDVSRIRTLLIRAGLPVSLPEYIDADLLLQKLYTDKKVRNGQLRFVLMDKIGAIHALRENDYGVPIPKETAAKILESVRG